MGSAAVAVAPASKPDTPSEDESGREPIHYLPVDRDEGERPYTPIPPAVFLASEGEEWELIDRAKAGDRKAVERIINAFSPIVPATIRAMPQVEKGTPLHADLYHDGVRALGEAIEAFDRDQGKRFGPYAQAAVRNTLIDKYAEYTAVVTVNREYRRFLRKFKDAELLCAKDPDRPWPWYGEVARHVAEEGREEIVRVWGQLYPDDPAPDPLWPEDAGIADVARQLGRIRHDPASRLQAWADGRDPAALAELKAKAERINRIVTCVGVLQAGLNATARPRELDAVQEIGGGYETPGEEESGHDLTPAPSTEPGAEKEAQHLRTRQEARSRLLGKLAEAADLPRQQAYAVKATLGLDGRGSRTPEEIAAELSALNGSEVRKDSVQRSLQRAAGRIWKGMTSPAGSILDPYLSEPEAPEPGILDAFKVAEAEREAARRRRYFDAFTAVEKEAAERWEEARRKDPPAPPSEDDVHDGPWTDPHTGERYRSAPGIEAKHPAGGRTIWWPWGLGFG